VRVRAVSPWTPRLDFVSEQNPRVVSLVTSAIVLALLLFHFFTEYRHRQLKGPQSERDIHRQVRVSGRHFMLSTTLFIAWIALMALVFSRIERWSYLDAIYFSVVTIETVGFGDFEPTHAASRVLLFPFALIGIAFLGTLIQMIVNFFSDRSAARKEKSRALYERERQEVEDQDQDPANLQKEIKFLDEINQRQDVKDQAAEFTMVRRGRRLAMAIDLICLS
jgi:potassium channel subfamily K